MKIDFKSIIRLLNPAPKIGGLEISDQAVRFLRIEGGQLKQALAQIPPGVVSNGKVQDRPRLLAALKAVHNQIDSSQKFTPSIFVMPSHNVYTQSFSIPPVPEKDLAETTRLNLEMISPIESKNSYRSYQMISENRGGKLEALGAFAISQDVDDFLSVIKEAKFTVIAVEFLAMALVRLIREYGVGIRREAPYLVVNLSRDGPDLSIIKNNNLYFNYFVPWKTLQDETGGRKFGTKEVQDFLVRHIKQIITFYSSRWGEQTGGVLLINSPISKDVIQTIKENFQLDVQFLTIAKFGHLSPLWIGSLGAALRGLIPRSKDNFISLTAVGVEEEYDHELITNFVRSWRNTIAITLGFLSLVFLVATFLLKDTAGALAKELENRGLVPLAEVQELKTAAERFNRSLDLALQAQIQSPAYSVFIERIRALAGSRIAIDRLYIDPNMRVLVSGSATNDAAVLDFKNNVSKEKNVKDVVLPLTTIKVNPNGSVSFVLQFELTSLNF